MELDKRKIIMDCDPGHDDAIAIMLAGRNPGIELLGITVVAGNQTIENTTRNALNICQYLDLDVPVYQGCGKPMIRQNQVIAEDIHGETGLDGPVFEPLTKTVEKKHAVTYIVDTLMESEGDITLIPTGPLTNIAMAMRMEPRIVSKIKEIILMGGCYQLGNVTPAAEFNIFADGDAAHVVFTSGRPITMVGLDVSRKALCYPAIIERMSEIDTPASKFFCDLMEFFSKSQKAVFGWDGGPLHDPITIATLIDPSVLVTREVYTEIDIRSTQSYGRTNCDYFNYFKKEPNSNIAVDIDVAKFWDIIEEGIKQYK